MGPLATAAARDRSLAAIVDAEASGATIVANGSDHRVADCDGGYFVGPTLVDNVSTEMQVYREEIFGPVLAVVRVESLDEAIDLINNNPYGNGAAIFTSSGASARRFERQATAGMIGVNVPIPVPVSFHSFGGWKASLFGDRHLYGREGFEFYTRGKVVTSRWSERKDASVTLSFPG
jgi:malonate-semialdehyde dehydrogenase (acetylating)/methylmalonate-semialdehyde dehydrogenase